MVQLARRALIATETSQIRAEMPDSFERYQALRLPQFLDADLLKTVQRAIGDATFYHRTHEGIGVEQCMRDNSTLALLYLLLNDQHLFDVIQQITGCARIGSFLGRVYRMCGGGGHYDSWHSDTGANRLIGISVNLSEQAFEGGRFELRKRGSDTLLWAVANTGPGDAILFRIADDLEHRVTAVEGHAPKTALAGWFQSHPDFLSVLKSGAPHAVAPSSS
ncbi:MAG TPA: 2OG-Fe(II) oxygenase [Vicinamibacterales bacterium]|jgi:hypothetical protein|nr:2OG-Fe(II) oxygenase [Vicinamibacterales bacterium]